MIGLLETHLAYLVGIVLLCLGLYIVIASPHLVKKLIGLNLFQTAIFLVLIVVAYVDGGASPVIPKDGSGGPFVSPLPHVLVLTAIVVGISTTAVGLSLCIRIHAAYGTLRTDALETMIARGETATDEDTDA